MNDLEKTLHSLQEQYRVLLQPYLKDGNIEINDSEVLAKAKSLQEKIKKAKNTIEEAKFYSFSDEEKMQIRKNDILIVRKFIDEGTNSEKLVYMEQYLKFLEKIQDALTSNPQDSGITAILDQLNKHVFIYSFDINLKTQILNQKSLKEAFLNLQKYLPYNIKSEK